MRPLSRRDILKSAASGAGLLLPLGLTSRALGFPWVAVALAIASQIASMVANHNRRNPDVYILSAVQDELRVVTEQLASLQSAVSAVLDELAKLPDVIRDIVAQQSLIDTQAKLKANVALYLEELSVRSQYSSDIDWLNASRRRERLNNIHDELAQNRQLLWQHPRSTNPSTAIVVSSTALVEINIMNILNIAGPIYDHTTIINLTKVYQDFFARVSDATDKNSTAGYALSSKAAQVKAISELDLIPLWGELNQYVRKWMRLMDLFL